MFEKCYNVTYTPKVFVNNESVQQMQVEICTSKSSFALKRAQDIVSFIFYYRKSHVTKIRSTTRQYVQFCF